VYAILENMKPLFLKKKGCVCRHQATNEDNIENKEQSFSIPIYYYYKTTSLRRFLEAISKNDNHHMKLQCWKAHFE